MTSIAASHGRSPRMLPAFTLTEMMVVLVIVGLLAAVVGPRLFSRLDVAKERTARLQVENLASAVTLFRIDTGRLPNDEEGLDALIHEPAEAGDWAGPYLAKNRIPLDPWGRHYLYRTDAEGKTFEILTYGASGKPDNKAGTISSSELGGALRPAEEGPKGPPLAR